MLSEAHKKNMEYGQNELDVDETTRICEEDQH